MELNYDEIAREILRHAKVGAAQNIPYPTFVLLRWQGKQYFGSIQEIYPKYSREIVFLSKTSRPIDSRLADSLRRQEQSILALRADDSLDLEGRGHILRRLEDRLTNMTMEQTAYARANPCRVIEINS